MTTQPTEAVIASPAAVQVDVMVSAAQDHPYFIVIYRSHGQWRWRMQGRNNVKTANGGEAYDEYSSLVQTLQTVFSAVLITNGGDTFLINDFVEIEVRYGHGAKQRDGVLAKSLEDLV